MTIKFAVPAILLSATNNIRETQLEAGTVKLAIDEMVAIYGDVFKRRVLDVTGKPTRLLNFFVNGRNITYIDGLDTKLRDDDTVMVMPVVGGG